MKSKPKLIIIGAGVVGATIAHSAQEKLDAEVFIIEKEKDPGQHASGRNSGVLHSGIYYPAETLKAKFCLSGNRYWQKFCFEHGLSISKDGKILLATNETEKERAQELLTNGQAAGISVEALTPEELQELEPRAQNEFGGLYLKDTAMVDPKQILAKVIELVKEAGGRVAYGIGVKSVAEARQTAEHEFDESFADAIVVNCTGTHADRIAHRQKLGRQYTLVPFRGDYLRLRDNAGFLGNRPLKNVYPIPDPKFPFLGVHVTPSVYGELFIGPTAGPVYGRQAYGRRFSLTGMFPILWMHIRMFLQNKQFRRLAIKGLRDIFIPHKKLMWLEARRLFPAMQYEDVKESNKVGIRPQLVHRRSGELVMDFVVESDSESVHVLNAVSPAFTSAPAFADFVVNDYIKPLVK